MFLVSWAQRRHVTAHYNQPDNTISVNNMGTSELAHALSCRTVQTNNERKVQTNNTNMNNNATIDLRQQPAWDFSFKKIQQSKCIRKRKERESSIIQSRPTPKQQISHSHTIFYQNTEFRHTQKRKKKGQKKNKNLCSVFIRFHCFVYSQFHKNISHNLDFQHLFSFHFSLYNLFVSFLLQMDWQNLFY